MRTVTVEKITEVVKGLCREAAFFIPKDVLRALEQAYKGEGSPLGREILNCIIENDRVAAKEDIPICQDTGLAVIFVDIGQDVHVGGGSLYDAVHEGIRRGYTDNYLRKSVVRDPLDRVNTGDNTPALIHTRIVPGNTIKIVLAPKGGGSENMSSLKMLPPSAGRDGVITHVIETVRQAGANPCPPVIVGVGIGANFEGCALLAKRALLRPIGSKNTDLDHARLEEELYDRINRLGIGPQGLGGRCTALAVFVEAAPCHITSIPVAVNMQCHAARHAEITL